MSNSETIILGIVSGIITSAVIYLFVIIFNHIVLPWYRAFIYRGVSIDGTWEGELDFGNGNTQVSTAELTQKANAISGNVTVVKSTNGQIMKTEIMSLSGTVKDRLFNAKLIPVDKKRVGIITVLLEVIGDGSRMRGSTTWYDSGAAKITGKGLEWARK